MEGTKMVPSTAKAYYDLLDAPRSADANLLTKNFKVMTERAEKAGDMFGKRRIK